MTPTTASAGTALQQVAPGVLAQVQGGKPFTVADLVEKLAAPAEELPPAAPFPPPAPPVTLTTALRKALTFLPKVFGKINPTERRALEEAELADLSAEALAIDALTKPLGARRKVISEMVRHHMDVEAEKGKKANPRTTGRVASGVAKGHYLLAEKNQPYETPVKGFHDCWQQRFCDGSTSTDTGKLEELLAAGEITRKEYLSFTREVRVLDESKISDAIRKDPGRGLQILAAITVREAPGTQLVSPKKPIETE